MLTKFKEIVNLNENPPNFPISFNLLFFSVIFGLLSLEGLAIPISSITEHHLIERKTFDLLKFEEGSFDTVFQEVIVNSYIEITLEKQIKPIVGDYYFKDVHEAVQKITGHLSECKLIDSKELENKFAVVFETTDGNYAFLEAKKTLTGLLNTIESKNIGRIMLKSLTSFLAEIKKIQSNASKNDGHYIGDEITFSEISKLYETFLKTLDAIESQISRKLNLIEAKLIKNNLEKRFFSTLETGPIGSFDFSQFSNYSTIQKLKEKLQVIKNIRSHEQELLIRLASYFPPSDGYLEYFKRNSISSITFNKIFNSQNSFVVFRNIVGALDMFSSWYNWEKKGVEIALSMLSEKPNGQRFLRNLQTVLKHRIPKNESDQFGSFASYRYSELLNLIETNLAE